jgi:hypothetical protein
LRKKIQKLRAPATIETLENLDQFDHLPKRSSVKKPVRHDDIEINVGELGEQQSCMVPPDIFDEYSD